jgi:hypothetical protein
MEYLQYYYKNLPNDIHIHLENYEPSSRTYAIRMRPSDITVWNKKAVNREIMYGTVVKKKD